MPWTVLCAEARAPNDVITTIRRCVGMIMLQHAKMNAQMVGGYAIIIAVWLMMAI